MITAVTARFARQMGRQTTKCSRLTTTILHRHSAESSRFALLLGSTSSRKEQRVFLSSVAPPTQPQHATDANFRPNPPESLTRDLAEGILETTQFYVRYGISKQRFQALADEQMDVVEKWHKMMEIYLTTQAHVIAGVGYPPNEEGLAKYAQHLATFMKEINDESAQELFKEVRRETWREIVATVFKIQPQDIPQLSIVDARNLMHKVSSRMMHPDTLLEIQTRTAKIQNENAQLEMLEKHQALQKVLVHEVYLGDSPSLVEEEGFGSGEVGYAKLQCAITDHDGDPLMAQYASAAMIKILGAAGIDVQSISGPGLGGGIAP